MTRTKQVFAFLAFQAAWFTCVLGAREGYPWLGSLAMLAFALIHLKSMGSRWGGDLLPILLSGLYGYVTDSLLLATNLLTFAQTTPPFGPSPMWMVALWLGFGATFNGSLAWLQRNLRLAAVVGLVSGPFAYGGGVALDMIEIGQNPIFTYTAVAFQWAIALTLLPAIAAASSPLRWNGEIVRRRVLTVTQYHALWALLTLLFPLVLALTLAVDFFRKILRGVPFTATRIFMAIYAYLSAQVLGLFFLTVAWVQGRGDKTRLVERSIPVQTAWTKGLFCSLCRIFGLTMKVEGGDQCAPGPIVTFFRHCSLFDTLLPTTFVTGPHGIVLKFVLKKELLLDPCLDVAGNRLGSYFVDRSAGDRDAEIQAIARLGEQLNEKQGVMIYPEGSRFTPERRVRALSRLKDTNPEIHARASRLKYLLPIRPAGSLALLDAQADIMIVGHKGFDAATNWAQLWNGDLVHKTIHIRMWRTAKADIPEGDEARIDWLYTQWEILDAWIDQLSTPKSSV